MEDSFRIITGIKNPDILKTRQVGFVLFILKIRL